MSRSRNVALALAAVIAATAFTALTPGAASAAPGTDLGPGEGYAGSGGAAGQGRRPAHTSRIPAGHLGGLDVSSWQGNVDWKRARGLGARFAVVKATESTGYKNPYFAQQYRGSRRAGLIRGAYHFALPNKSSGKAQADHFLANGGKWRPDGRTLPGALDIENNPYRNGLNRCFGLSARSMVKWIGDFTARYRARTGRRPLIYTNYHWWKDCTGDTKAFRSHPLWMARWRTDVPSPLPGGWRKATIWQYDDAGRFVGDQNAYKGTARSLAAFAGRSGR